MKTKGFLLAVAFATMAFTFSCSSDDGDGGGGGGLSGTSWEQKSKSSSFDFTYTITFKSATEMSYNQKGWGMVGNKKNNYDQTTNGTYEYFPKTKEGIIHCSVFTANTFVFAISDDSKTMSSKTSTAKYTRR